jgi:hypothetical protein
MMMMIATGGNSAKLQVVPSVTLNVASLSSLSRVGYNRVNKWLVQGVTMPPIRKGLILTDILADIHRTLIEQLKQTGSGRMQRRQLIQSLQSTISGYV